MAHFLLLALAAGLAGRTQALRAAGADCQPVWSVVSTMRRNPLSALHQRWGCGLISRCVDTSSKQAQDEAAAAGALEAVVLAMRQFPEDKDLQSQCIGAAGRPTIFNRENSLRAGRLGALNLTLRAYRRWMDEPRFTNHGGDIGCFLDFSNENRAILRELGGVQMLIQNIRNNFHGRLSEWDYSPVKHSLFGLSSGTWTNSDIAHAEGFIPLALQLMTEHTAEDKIAEETLQAAKAMFFASDEYRREFTQRGLPRAMIKVLRENPHDRGAVSLVCESLRYLVGPSAMVSPVGDHAFKEQDPQILAEVTRAGMVEQLLETVMAGASLQHKEHGSFNFDVDEAYNARADCLEALATVGTNSETNILAMLKAGLVDHLVARLQAGKDDRRARVLACRVLGMLLAPAQNGTAQAVAKGAADACPPGAR